MSSSNTDVEYTPTQRRLMTMLSDYKAHSIDELHSCLSDDLASLGVVKAHINLLRQKIREKNLDVLCRAGAYQLVRI